MKQYITGHSLAADARMRRTATKVAFLFVEGVSDLKLYGKFVERAKCQIIIAHTKSNVIEACQYLQQEGFAGAIGIVDADFEHLDGFSTASANVFRTDHHDGECHMLANRAFNDVLCELAAADKLSAWQEATGSNPRQHLLNQAAFVGCLLKHSLRNRLNLVFEDLEPKVFGVCSTICG